MDDDQVKIVCSVIPGFESIALIECQERLGLVATRDIRGRITFDIEVDRIVDLLELRAVHHYWVVVEDKEDFFKPDQTKEQILKELDLLPAQLNWTKALRTWKKFRTFKQNNGGLETVSERRKKRKKKEGGVAEKEGGVAEEEDDVHELDYSTVNPETDGEKVRYRATASRTGTHVFSSMEAAWHVGAGVNDHLHWKVALSVYDVEVVVYIVNTFISVGIQITKEAQSLRNITHFGPTTLKPNISYCLLRTTLFKPGDVICDPMCGGGSIPLEGAHSLQGTFHLGGDNHPLAVSNAAENMESLAAKKLKSGKSSNPTPNMSIVHWDVYSLPLRDACLDHIVTDLPFGKKIGSQERNMFLYPKALKEMARICRPGGKAILLTHHKEAMRKALGKVREYWKYLECRRINMGGLNVSVYILVRTKKTYVKWTGDSQDSKKTLPKEVLDESTNTAKTED